MNDDQFGDLHAWIEPELEARIAALVLGEASAFETDELERLMEERTELRLYKRRLEKVHGLLREAVKPGDDGEWRLSGERRAELFEKIGMEVDEEDEVVVLSVGAGNRETRIRRQGLRVAMMAAACLVISFLLVPFFMSGGIGSKKESATAAGADKELRRKNMVPTDQLPSLGRLFASEDARGPQDRENQSVAGNYTGYSTFDAPTRSESGAGEKLAALRESLAAAWMPEPPLEPLGTLDQVPRLVQTGAGQPERRPSAPSISMSGLLPPRGPSSGGVMDLKTANAEGRERWGEQVDASGIAALTDGALSLEKENKSDPAREGFDADVSLGLRNGDDQTLGSADEVFGGVQLGSDFSTPPKAAPTPAGSKGGDAGGNLAWHGQEDLDARRGDPFAAEVAKEVPGQGKGQSGNAPKPGIEIVREFIYPTDYEGPEGNSRDAILNRPGAADPGQPSGGRHWKDVEVAGSVFASKVAAEDGLEFSNGLAGVELGRKSAQLGGGSGGGGGGGFNGGADGDGEWFYAEQTLEKDGKELADKQAEFGNGRVVAGKDAAKKEDAGFGVRSIRELLVWDPSNRRWFVDLVGVYYGWRDSYAAREDLEGAVRVSLEVMAVQEGQLAREGVKLDDYYALAMSERAHSGLLGRSEDGWEGEVAWLRKSEETMVQGGALDPENVYMRYQQGAAANWLASVLVSREEGKEEALACLDRAKEVWTSLLGDERISEAAADALEQQDELYAQARGEEE
ncbi:MAG: hypothetical protein O3A92_16735 [Verrucomicrobia bacterium]|nr:hypothetical protein [Verrucomicrobiota bacterium]